MTLHWLTAPVWLIIWCVHCSSEVVLLTGVMSWVPQQARERRERQLVTVTVTQINDNSTTHVAATNKHEVHYKTEHA